MAESVVRLSPRQKMINLMYIVLTAMLALNVSSDVLDGFVQVEDGLARTNANIGRRNDAIYGQLESFTQQNPEKGTPWLKKASQVRKNAASLYTLVDSLKLAIVRQADGEEGSPDNINRRDDLDFVIHAGDMTDFGMRAEFERSATCSSACASPMSCCRATTTAWPPASGSSPSCSGRSTSPSRPGACASSA